MTKLENDKLEEFKKDTKDEDEAFQQWLKWKCLTDLYFLGTEVLGWRPVKRRDRIDPKFHRWLCGALQKDEDKLILVPRDHLKTTWVKVRIIQKLLQNPNRVIGLISATGKLVEKETKDIKRWLCTPLLRQLFPEIIPDPGKDFRNWELSRGDEFTMRRDRTVGFVPQDPQLTGVGIGAEITGIHLTDLFMEDVVTWMNIQTAEQMDKAEQFWSYMQSIIEKGAEVTITGTFYHYLDLYNKIIKGQHIDRVYIRRAIENNKPIYNYFTLKDLEKKKRRMRLEEWNSQWMLDPSPTSEKIFPPPQPTYDVLPPDDYKYYITVDPAPTVSKTSDHTGIVVGAVNSRGVIYIVEATKVKLKGDEKADLIIRKLQQYDPTRIGIEFGLQQDLQYLLQLKLNELKKEGKYVAFPLLPIKTSPTKTKRQRIGDTLGAFCREGRCRINSRCVDLIRQMECFTGSVKDEDDLVDAASMLFQCVETFAQHYWKENIYRGYATTAMEAYFKPRTKTMKWEDVFVAG